MFLLFQVAAVALIAALASSVEAKNETLGHGWESEPPGRGTWCILWSCLATVLFCTWSTLHLDAPSRHGRCYLLVRKVFWMFVVTIAPEIILCKAARHYIHARGLSKHLAQKCGCKEWTLTHCLFAYAGGFQICSEGSEFRPCDPRTALSLIETGAVVPPMISAKELMSRGTSDGIFKIISLIQTLWFVAQIICRAVHHYPATGLEIMTGAFVFCAFLIYAFSRHMPQNIEYPITLHRWQDKDDDTEALEITTKSSTSMDLKATATPSGCSMRTVRSSLDKSCYLGISTRSLAYILCLLSACGFGAIHCSAWNSPFPTSKERLAWRICSIVTTVLPAPMAFAILLFKRLDAKCPPTCREARMKWRILVYSVITIIYAVGRGVIIGLAFASLRALPPKAFQTVKIPPFPF